MHENTFIKFLPRQIRNILISDKIDLNKIQEIRIRTGKPVMVLDEKGEIILNEFSNNVHFASEADLREMLEYISNYSLYAYDEEMRQGFITIEGGHRIGLCGQVIVENGKIKNLRYISSVNVRIAHEVKGCADEILPYLIEDRKALHTLIISPPRCGKTTMLRDIIRQISDGNEYIKGQTVGVVDERSEIGGCYRGVSQNQLGIRTDILDGCPKAEGMLMLIRSMGPEVIAVDEIGTREDVHAVDYAMHCGCKMIATVHGKSLEEIKDKPVLGELVKERRFESYILLSNKRGVGSVEAIYDENCGSIFNCGNNEYMGDGKSRKSEKAVGEHERFTKNHLLFAERNPVFKSFPGGNI